MPGEPPGPSDPLDPAGLVGRAAEAAAIRRMLDGAVCRIPSSARRRCWCGDNSAAFVEPYAAPPLGLLDLAEGWCRASMMPVGDGGQLLLYTDGVSEARDADGRFFPLAQVTADTVCGAGPDRAPLLDVLVARLDQHVGDRRRDDILLLLLVTMR